MEMVFQLFRWFRRAGWKLRRCWRSVYYGITNLLMILGGSVILSALWYFMFFLRR